MRASPNTGTITGWINGLAHLVCLTFVLSSLLFAGFVVGSLGDRDTSHNSDPVRSDHRPDIRHCFKDNAAPLWDCIRHKE